MFNFYKRKTSFITIYTGNTTAGTMYHFKRFIATTFEFINKGSMLKIPKRVGIKILNLNIMKKFLFVFATALSLALNAQVNSPSGVMGISTPTVGIGTTTTNGSFGVHLFGGIGQAIPQGLFIQRSDFPATNQDCAMSIHFTSNAFTAATIGGGSANFILVPSINTPSPDMAFSTNNVKPQFIIKNSGRIGIGTTTPGDKLEINSGANGRSGLRFTKLTALTATTATPGDFACNKVLSVDNNGEVILIDLNTCGSSSRIGATDETLLVLQNQITEMQAQIDALKSIIATNVTAEKVNISTKPELKIAPNPANKTASVSYTLPVNAKVATLQITNMLGEVMQVYALENNSNTIQINVAPLMAGTYIYTMVVDGSLITGNQLIVTE